MDHPHYFTALLPHVDVRHPHVLRPRCHLIRPRAVQFPSLLTEQDPAMDTRARNIHVLALTGFEITWPHTGSVLFPPTMGQALAYLYMHHFLLLLKESSQHWLWYRFRPATNWSHVKNALREAKCKMMVRRRPPPSTHLFR